LLSFNYEQLIGPRTRVSKACLDNVKYHRTSMLLINLNVKVERTEMLTLPLKNQEASANMFASS